MKQTLQLQASAPGSVDAVVVWLDGVTAENSVWVDGYGLDRTVKGSADSTITRPADMTPSVQSVYLLAGQSARDARHHVSVSGVLDVVKGDLDVTVQWSA